MLQLKKFAHNIVETGAAGVALATGAGAPVVVAALAAGAALADELALAAALAVAGGVLFAMNTLSWSWSMFRLF